jgi:hypothetical protein
MMHILVLLLAILLALVSPVAAQFSTIPPWQGGLDYHNGDLVKFNGTMWICNQPTCTANVSPGSPGGGFWNAMSGVSQWRGDLTYQPGQQVMRNGTQFTALVTNTNQDPAGGVNPNWKARASTPPPAILATDIDGTGPKGADIQAAIDAAPPGGVVQLLCAAYTLTGSLSITKALTLQGCGPGGMQFPGGMGSQLIGAACCDNITVNTIYGVVLRDLVLQIATNKAGLVITTPGAVPGEGNINDRTIIERVWFRDGGWGIISAAGRVRGTLISHSYFNSQTQAGVLFQGVAHTVCNIINEPYPSCSTGTHVDNCDGGGYTITDSIFEGNASAGSDAMQFVNSAAVTLKGNQAIAWGRDVVSFTQSCFSPGPAPSQFQIVGNQFEASIGRSAIRVSGQHVGWFFGSNYLSGLTGPAVLFSSSPSAPSYQVQLTGNQLRIFGSPASTQPALSLNNVAGVSVTGNGITAGQNGTAPNGVVMTDVSLVSITGNTMGLGANVTNGFNITCTSGTSCVCAAGNILSVTGSKFPGAPATGGC